MSIVRAAGQLPHRTPVRSHARLGATTQQDFTSWGGRAILADIMDPMQNTMEALMTQGAELARLKWALTHDLIPVGVRMERLRVLAQLGSFATWAEAEHQHVERVLDAFAETLALLNTDPQTTAEVVTIQARIESNLEVMYTFLASTPAYLGEPEFSTWLHETVLRSSAHGGPLEQARAVGA